MDPEKHNELSELLHCKAWVESREAIAVPSWSFFIVKV